jgi:hypothetical protein
LSNGHRFMTVAAGYSVPQRMHCRCEMRLMAKTARVEYQEV